VIKVLHIYRTYYPDPPGGLQEAIRQICESTRTQQVESRVFALSPTPEPEVVTVDATQVIRARSWWAPASCDLGGLDAMHRFAEAAQWANVLHFHFPWPYADLLNLMPCANKPKVMTYHSDIVRQRVLGMLYRPLMRKTLASMDAVVATSPVYAASSSILQTHVDPDKLRVIPLAITDLVGTPQAAKLGSAGLDRLGLAPDTYVMALGVLRYYKGFHTLVHAATRVRCKIVIAGSGPEETRLRALVESTGARNVIFAGRVNDQEKHELLSQCRAFVLPSHLRSEAFGVVLLEASMHSKPMVACEINSGMSYVNIHGETGLMVPPESPDELAAAINTLIEDGSLATKMGVRAHERFLLLFSSQAQGESYANLYREVAGKCQ